MPDSVTIGLLAREQHSPGKAPRQSRDPETDNPKRISTPQLVFLIAIFFFTSVLSVVTGSTALITVPAMISLGLEPHIAIATNSAGLAAHGFRCHDCSDGLHACKAGHGTVHSRSAGHEVGGTDWLLNDVSACRPWRVFDRGLELRTV
jgi:hypothetical protein